MVSRVVRAAAATAAGDQAADRDETRADTAGERRGDAGILKIELSVADLRLGVVDRGLCSVLLGVRWSTVSGVAKLLRWSDCARPSSLVASAKRADAVCNRAFARASLIS